MIKKLKTHQKLQRMKRSCRKMKVSSFFSSDGVSSAAKDPLCSDRPPTPHDYKNIRYILETLSDS